MTTFFISHHPFLDFIAIYSMKGGDKMMQQTRLTLQFHHGVDVFGENIFKDKRFNNIKGTSLDVDLEETALALGTLQKHSLIGVVRNNSYSLA